MIDSTHVERQIVRAKQNIVSDMDGEKVMLDIASGKYYNLGAVGGAIWDLLEQPMTVKQLVDELVKQYDVEQAVCEEQVLAFLEQLSAEGLIQ